MPPSTGQGNAYVMPRPPAVVVWRAAPGGESNYAVVTKYGRHAIALMIFPSDSRVGVPKESVRFIGDPWNKINGISPDSGVWEFTDETKRLMALEAKVEATYAGGSPKSVK
jgi:hypothetical protein